MKQRRRIEQITLAAIAVLVVGALAYRLTVVPSESADAALASQSSPLDALAGLERAAGTNPDSLRAWQDLGAGYVDIGLQLSEPGLFTKGEAALDRADEITPRDATTLVARAQLAVTRHQFVEAEAFASEALEHLPYNSQALAARTDAQVETGQYKTALASADEFASRRPGGAALARVSYLRQLHGDMNGALAALAEAEAAVVSSGAYQRATVAAIRGDVLMKMGQVDRAEVEYQKAVSIQPNHLVGTVGLAQVHARTWPRAEAIAELEAIVADSATFSTVDLLLALYEQDGNDAGAAEMKAYYADLIAGEREAGAVVDLEAATFEATYGSSESAVALAQKAYAAQPNIYAADALAWALHRDGQSAKALAFSNESLRLGTVDAQFFVHNAAIQAALGDRETAVEMLTEAARINPGYSVADQPMVQNFAADLGVDWPTR